MAAKVRKGVRLQTSAEHVSAEERIARLLGILAVKDLSGSTEKVVRLRAIGFQPSDIASMLGISENAVAVASYQARKQQGKKSK